MNKEVTYSGMTTVPSDYDCPDGSLALAINLVPEDGGIKPVSPPKTIAEIPSSYNIVFIHKINSATTCYIAEHFGDDGAVDGLYYTGDFDSYSLCCEITGRVKSMQAVGKVVSVLAEDEFFYLRYDAETGSYKKISSDFPHLDIAFALSGTLQNKGYEDTGAAYGEVSLNDLTYDNIVLSKDIATTDGEVASDVSLDAGSYLITHVKNAWFNYLEIYGEADGEKVLITTVKNSKWYFKTDVAYSNISFKLYSNKNVYYSTVFTLYCSSDAESSTVSTYQLTNDEDTYNAVLGSVNAFMAQVEEDNCFIYPFYVRYALRMYDGSHICHSVPVLMIPGLADNPRVRWWLKSSSKVVLNISAIECNLQYGVVGEEARDTLLRIKDEYKDLITAVDFFISASVYTYNQGKEFKKDERIIHNVTDYTDENDPNFGYMSLDGGSTYARHSNTEAMEGLVEAAHTVSIPTFSDKEISQKLADTSVFYKIKSVNIEDLTIGGLADMELDAHVLTGLEGRETLEDDTIRTHNVKFPSTLFAYNSRLDIASVKEVLYTGCSPFFCNGFNTAVYNSTLEFYYMYAKIYIKTDDGEKTVTTAPSPSVKGDIYIAYFFYPDTRAYKAEIYYVKKMMDYYYIPSGAVASFSLQPHATLNGSYWLYRQEYAAPLHIKLSTSYEVSQAVQEQPYAIAAETASASKIFTSEVSNPFLFVSSTTVGTGNVLRLCSAVKALSQGQFGQFPLYAFTDEGVWALETAADGGFAAVRPVSRDVCANEDSITQIDTAVLFATDRGIMLIGGSETICLSDVLDGESVFPVASLPKAEEAAALAGFSPDCFSFLPFKDFVKGCRMIYDYRHQRILVYNPSCVYAYVYSLKSKQWGMMQSAVVGSVNSYPDAFATLADNSLVNFSDDADDTYNGLAITRPLKLDLPDVPKTIDCVIQRGFFRKGHVKCVLYGSRDLVNWFVVRSSSSHFLRGFSGSPYKYFRLVLICSLAADENLAGCSVNYSARFTDRMR